MSENRLNLCGVQEDNTLGAILLIAVDTSIPIAPKSTADHQVLQQSITTAVLVGTIEYIQLGRTRDLFTPLLGASVKMNWERAE